MNLSSLPAGDLYGQTPNRILHSFKISAGYHQVQPARRKKSYWLRPSSEQKGGARRMSSFQTNNPDDLPSLLVLKSNSSLFSHAEAKLGMILHLEQSVLLLNTKPLLPGRNRVTSQRRESRRHVGVWKQPWWMLHKSNDWTWGLCSIDEDGLKPLCGDMSSSACFTLYCQRKSSRENTFSATFAALRGTHKLNISRKHIYSVYSGLTWPHFVHLLFIFILSFFLEVNRWPVINLMQLLNMEVVCFHHLLPTLPVYRGIMTCPEHFWLCNEWIIINSSSSILCFNLDCRMRVKFFYNSLNELQPRSLHFVTNVTN